MNLKVTILGDNSVGKSSLLTEKFYSYTKDTLGPDMSTRKITIGDTIVTVQFWDMPGRRDQRSSIVPYYQGTHCCILVYDVTSLDSFESLEYWQKEFLTEISLPDEKWFPFVVIGNKFDLEDRVVNEERAKSWCRVNKVHSYFETSAKDSTNVTEALRISVQNAFDYNKKSIIRPDQNQNNSWFYCCSLFSHFYQ